MNDHKKFLEMNNPATEALKFVLLRNASDVLYDAEMMRRYLQSISMGQRRSGDGVIDARIVLRSWYSPNSLLLKVYEETQLPPRKSLIALKARQDFAEMMLTPLIRSANDNLVKSSRG